MILATFNKASDTSGKPQDLNLPQGNPFGFSMIPPSQPPKNPPVEDNTNDDDDGFVLELTRGYDSNEKSFYEREQERLKKEAAEKEHERQRQERERVANKHSREHDKLMGQARDAMSVVARNLAALENRGADNLDRLAGDPLENEKNRKAKLLEQMRERRLNRGRGGRGDFGIGD